MKIIFLVPVVPPAINGIGEYTFHLVKGLREAGADAHIVTSSGQPAAESWIHPVLSHWTPKEVAQHLHALQPNWVSLQYVPQLYHPKGLCWKVSGIPAHIKKTLKCKVSVTFHEFSCAWGYSLKKIAMALFLRLQTRRLLRGCDFAVTTCEIYKKILREYSKQTPVDSIPVGANITPAPISEKDTLALKKKWGVQEGKIFAIFGRLSNFRNHSLALDVLKQARIQGIPAYLLLIGCMRTSNPVLFNELILKAEKENLKQWLVETGDLSPEQISHALTQSDVFLFPQTDGISTRNTTVMSALAHGLPIVSFAPSPGNFEEPSIPYAALVPQGDEALFIEKALHFAFKKPDDKSMADQTAYYAARFSWQTISSRYLTLMTSK